MGINANKLRTSYTRNANSSVFLISLKSAANALDMYTAFQHHHRLVSRAGLLIRLCDLFSSWGVHKWVCLSGLSAILRWVLKYYVLLWVRIYKNSRERSVECLA